MGDPRLTELCASVRDLFDARACVCAVVRDGEVLEFVAGDGAAASDVVGLRLAVGQGIAGYVAQAGVPVEVTDVPNDERFAANLPVHDRYVPTWFLGTPLLAADGRVLGVLNVLDPSADVVREIGDAAGEALPVLGVMAAEVARVVADGLDLANGQGTGSTARPHVSFTIRAAEAYRARAASSTSR